MSRDTTLVSRRGYGARLGRNRGTGVTLPSKFLDVDGLGNAAVGKPAAHLGAERLAGKRCHWQRTPVVRGCRTTSTRWPMPTGVGEAPALAVKYDVWSGCGAGGKAGFGDLDGRPGCAEMRASCYPSVARSPPSPRLWPTSTSWDVVRAAPSQLHVASPHPLSPTAASCKPAPSLAGKLPGKGRSQRSP
ncbi:hypothetical protein VUR80DRAFT_494 [Thermomyces stellatus]